MIIFFIGLLAIKSTLFACIYSDLRQTLEEWETSGLSKAAIARRLDLPYGTLYSFLSKEGATSPTVLEKYKSYIKKQTPTKQRSIHKTQITLKLETKPSFSNNVLRSRYFPEKVEQLGKDKGPFPLESSPLVPGIKIEEQQKFEKTSGNSLVKKSIAKSIPVVTSTRSESSQKPVSITIKDNPTLNTIVPRQVAVSSSLDEGKEIIPHYIVTQSKYEDGYDSEDEENWKPSQKEYSRTQRKNDEVLVPFFRGVHCFRNYFPGEEKSRFLNDQQVGEGVFSTASFDILQLEYTEQSPSTQLVKYRRFSNEMKRAIRQKALEIQSNNIRKQVNKLKEGAPVIVDGIRFKNPQVGLYYLYVKSYARFLERLKNHTLLPEEALKEFIAVANTIASAAELPDHAIRYAAGLKIEGNVLRPEFDAQGKPKNPYLGKVYVILVPYQDIERVGLFRVLEAYATNEMPVNCRIINECEADFAGGIPGRYVVSEQIIRVPNFKHEWKRKHEVKYGLTKRMYDNLRKEIIATKGNVLNQEPVYEKLIQQIINHKYRQQPNDRTLSNQLLEIARNEAWLRGANLQFLDFRRLPTSTRPTVEKAKSILHQIKPN